MGAGLCGSCVTPYTTPLDVRQSTLQLDYILAKKQYDFFTKSGNKAKKKRRTQGRVRRWRKESLNRD